MTALTAAQLDDLSTMDLWDALRDLGDAAESAIRYHLSWVRDAMRDGYWPPLPPSTPKHLRPEPEEVTELIRQIYGEWIRLERPWWTEGPTADAVIRQSVIAVILTVQEASHA